MHSTLVRVLALGALALVSVRAAANENTPLEIGPDGRIEGLPEQFAPFYVRVGHHRPFPWFHREIEVQLQAGDRQRTLPRCIARLFEIPEAMPILVEGRWDDARGFMNIVPITELLPDALFAHLVMVDLRTAAVVQVWERTPTTDRQIELQSVCTPEEVDSAVRP